MKTMKMPTRTSHDQASVVVCEIETLAIEKGLDYDSHALLNQESGVGRVKCEIGRRHLTDLVMDSKKWHAVRLKCGEGWVEHDLDI